MKFIAQVTISLAAAVVFLACMTTTGYSADLTQSVTLVATSRLVGSVYEEAVIVAAPSPGGAHVGFILNRPTRVRLATAFPEHAPSTKVSVPLFLGGPFNPRTIVAVMRQAPSGTSTTIPLMPGLVAVIDGASIDQVIETRPNEARYFVGIVLWAQDELEQETRRGDWNVRPANADFVFSANPAGLWKDLSGARRPLFVRLGCQLCCSCVQ